MPGTRDGSGYSVKGVVAAVDTNPPTSDLEGRFLPVDSGFDVLKARVVLDGTTPEVQVAPMYYDPESQAMATDRTQVKTLTGADIHHVSFEAHHGNRHGLRVLALTGTGSPKATISLGYGLQR